MRSFLPFLKLFMLFFLVAESLTSQSISTLGIPYQAMLVTSEVQLMVGEDLHFLPLKNTKIYLRISLQNRNGQVYYVEEHGTQTNGEGYFSVVVGRGQPAQSNSLTFAQLDWSGVAYFMKVEWSAALKKEYKLMSIQPLLSVPYALYAEQSGSQVTKDPYQLWRSLGYTGSQEDFIRSQTGEKGEKGDPGPPGEPGERGADGNLSAGKRVGNTPIWGQDDWVVDTEGLQIDGQRMLLGEGLPDPSALLTLSSQNQGFLPNRMTIEQRDALVDPPEGLMIFNTTTGCPNYFQDGKWWDWCGGSAIEGLECNAGDLGTLLLAGQSLYNIPFSVQYRGGKGDAFEALSIPSKGVKGLVAFLEQGAFSEEEGQFFFRVEGTAQGVGVAEFPIRLGGLTCTARLPVRAEVQIGDLFQGGIVAYVFGPGDKGYVPGEQHGLIVAQEDLPGKYAWGPALSAGWVESFLSGLSTEVGWGLENSLLLQGVGGLQGVHFAALKACLPFSYQGFDDWFLPTSGELQIAKDNLANSGLGNFFTDSQTGGNLNTGYWSSSIAQNYAGALAPMMAPGAGVCGCAFFESYRVRPMRYF
jgi:hypothetical protein